MQYTVQKVEQDGSYSGSLLRKPVSYGQARVIAAKADHINGGHCEFVITPVEEKSSRVRNIVLGVAVGLIAGLAVFAAPVSAADTVQMQADGIVAQGRTVEVDCDSTLAAELASRGWFVSANDDAGQCDAAPTAPTYTDADVVLAFQQGYYQGAADAAEGIGIDVTNAPPEYVNMLMRHGYWSDPSDGREMLYPPVPQGTPEPDDDVPGAIAVAAA